jgi:hypothetical protein
MDALSTHLKNYLKNKKSEAAEESVSTMSAQKSKAKAESTLSKLIDEEDSDAMKEFLNQHAEIDDDENDENHVDVEDDDVANDLRFQKDVSFARNAFERSSLEAKVASGTDRDGSAQQLLEELEAKAKELEAKKQGSAGVQWGIHFLFLIAAVYFGWRFISEGGYSTLSRDPIGSPAPSQS